jgi:hypothetical protein
MLNSQNREIKEARSDNTTPCALQQHAHTPYSIKTGGVRPGQGRAYLEPCLLYLGSICRASQEQVRTTEGLSARRGQGSSSSYFIPAVIISVLLFPVNCFLCVLLGSKKYPDKESKKKAAKKNARVDKMLRLLDARLYNIGPGVRARLSWGVAYWPF